mgnify:CR=1 FL=1
MLRFSARYHAIAGAVKYQISLSGSGVQKTGRWPEAIEKGDISENAEYDAAKDAQGLLEAKIAQLKDTIATCRVIDESQIDTSKVQMLNKVTIKNTKTGATMTYTLVSETEANFKEGKLSIHTPIAQALVGKKLGDKVMVKVPAGEMEFEIMDISL